MSTQSHRQALKTKSSLKVKGTLGTDSGTTIGGSGKHLQSHSSIADSGLRLFLQ
ncbi:hypothetical protein LL972_01905 [Xanthomonas campestris pv. asclepiadis]|uniref:hypothetical protein n=1 Tax=Xanthomonas campestris TaxID=339 RepID=UPI001E3A5421|nr:hypothetical protein [Xanthomonas campestris]MCC4614796.1 hypothetical protein [Xanthomonas campestris pv. asclepiadis]